MVDDFKEPLSSSRAAGKLKQLHVKDRTTIGGISLQHPTCDVVEPRADATSFQNRSKNRAHPWKFL